MSDPTREALCGALGLCELPKGHADLHSTSVERAAELDATHGFLVFEGPDGELMRTPYRALAAPSTPAPLDAIGHIDGAHNHNADPICRICGVALRLYRSTP